VADVVVGQVEVGQVEARVQVLDLLHPVVLQEQALQLGQMTEKIIAWRVFRMIIISLDLKTL
jgi:hypothetical protein